MRLMNRELQAGIDKLEAYCWNAKKAKLAGPEPQSRTANREASPRCQQAAAGRQRIGRPELASNAYKRENGPECHKHVPMADVQPTGTEHTRTQKKTPLPLAVSI